MGDVTPCHTVVNKFVTPETEISVWGESLVGQEAFLEMCIKLKRGVEFSSVNSEAIFTNIPMGVAAIRSEVYGTCYSSGNRLQGAEMVAGIEWNMVQNKLKKMVLLFPNPEEWAIACATDAVKNSYRLMSTFFSEGFSEQSMDLISDDAVFRAPNFMFFIGDRGQQAPQMEMRGKNGLRDMFRIMSQLFDYTTVDKRERKVLYQDDATVVSEIEFTVTAKLTGKQISRVAYSTHRFDAQGRLVFCECLLDEPLMYVCCAVASPLPSVQMF